MHVKSSASSSPALHAGAPAPSSSAKAGKVGNTGTGPAAAPDFSQMLKDAKAAAPTASSTAPATATASAPSTTPSTTTAASPSTLSLDTASLAARG